MNPDAGMAVLILVGLVVIELLRLIVRYVFKRFTNPEYITREDCANCSASKEEALAGMREDFRAVKKLLFVVALKVGVTEEEISPLVG